MITVKKNKKETKSGDNGTFTIALFDEYGNPVRNEYGSNPAAREGIGHFIFKAMAAFHSAVIAVIWTVMDLTGNTWRMISMDRKMIKANLIR